MSQKHQSNTTTWHLLYAVAKFIRLDLFFFLQGLKLLQELNGKRYISTKLFVNRKTAAKETMDVMRSLFHNFFAKQALLQTSIQI